MIRMRVAGLALGLASLLRPVVSRSRHVALMRFSRDPIDAQVAHFARTD